MFRLPPAFDRQFGAAEESGREAAAVAGLRSRSLPTIYSANVIAAARGLESIERRVVERIDDPQTSVQIQHRVGVLRLHAVAMPQPGLVVMVVGQRFTDQERQANGSAGSTLRPGLMQTLWIRRSITDAGASSRAGPGAWAANVWCMPWPAPVTSQAS
jgi:hypothetical protein